MGASEFTPEDFLALMRREIPLYDELQERTVAATEEIDAKRILELGFGTGETTRRVLARHPGAHVLGLDGSSRMLAAIELDGAEFRRAELTDPLPQERFDLVVSCLTIHHLTADQKRDLFARVAAVAEWLVFGGVVVPKVPANAVVPLVPEYDYPNTVADQLAWLREAGFEAEATWERDDLAVIRGRAARRERSRRWKRR